MHSVDMFSPVSSSANGGAKNAYSHRAICENLQISLQKVLSLSHHSSKNHENMVQGTSHVQHLSDCGSSEADQSIDELSEVVEELSEIVEEEEQDFENEQIEQTSDSHSSDVNDELVNSCSDCGDSDVESDTDVYSVSHRKSGFGQCVTPTASNCSRLVSLCEEAQLSTLSFVVCVLYSSLFHMYI